MTMADGLGVSDLGINIVKRRPMASAPVKQLPRRHDEMSGSREPLYHKPGQSLFPRSAAAFLFHYVRKRPLIHLAALLSVIIAAGLASTTQFGMKLVVDAMAGGPKNSHAVWLALSFFAFLFGFEAVFWRIGGFFGCGAIVKDKSELKFDLFQHLSGHSGRFFSDQMGGALANRISSTGDAAHQVFSGILFNITPVCADFIVASFILGTIDWHLVAGLAVFGVLVVIGFAFLGARGRPIHKDFADRSAKVGGELVDVVSNMWTVKAFSGRAREQKRFQALLDSEANAHRRSWMYVEGMRVIHDIGLWLVAGAMLIWTVHLWTLGRVTAGDVIVTSGLAFRILHGSRDLAFAMVNSAQFMARIADAIQIIGVDHDVPDHVHARRFVQQGGAIQFDNVGFAYADGRKIFRNFSLDIHPGQKVGLVGPSGAGKSSLISMVQRLADVQEGHVLIDGQDVRNMTQDSLREAIAIVPQEITLFHRSLMENIRYGRPDASDDEVYAAAKAARCDGFIQELDEGYDSLVGERGTKLSGGQRQRIGIARAILKDAPIILLDEATSALDTESEVEIQRALENLMQGRTVLAIAHRLSTVAGFDRVIVMRNGKIVEDGTPRNLRQEDGAFNAMWSLQANSMERELESV